VFPLGVFLFNHLLTNSTGIFGAEFFEHKVALIHSLGPALPIIEALFIFIPLALHIGLGVYIATQSKIEWGPQMPYLRNLAFILQRLTGWVALAFIVYHVVHLRFLHDMSKEPFSMELAGMFTHPAFGIPIILIYLLSGLAVIFHFANGLCTFCMSWGITVGPNSQRLMAYAATGVGAVLTVMLLTSIMAFTRIGLSDEYRDPVQREAMIQRLLDVHKH
jgi:succinate dehydrogenase / fumarate reductase cytochrome b subunit